MAGITLVDGDVSLNPLRRTDLDVTPSAQSRGDGRSRDTHGPKDDGHAEIRP